MCAHDILISHECMHMHLIFLALNFWTLMDHQLRLLYYICYGYITCIITAWVEVHDSNRQYKRRHKDVDRSVIMILLVLK